MEEASELRDVPAQTRSRRFIVKKATRSRCA